MKKLNIDATKALSFGGIVLSLVGTLLSGAASDKKTKAHIEKVVKEELNKK